MAERRHSETVRALYDFWSERFFDLAQGPHRVEIHDGKATEAHKLMAAVLGLLRNMRPDGHLAYQRSGDDFSVEQLAAFMHVSKTTAIGYLEWLRREGCMTEQPQWGDKGQPLSSVRRLVMPAEPTTPSPALSADLDLGSTATPSPVVEGPKSSQWGSQVQSSSSELVDTQETRRTRRRRSLVSDDVLVGDANIEGAGFLWEEEPEPDEVVEHPAYLSRETWQRVLSRLGHRSMFRRLSAPEPLEGTTMRVQAVGSQTLVFWTSFKYGLHRGQMERDAPEVRRLVRELLGADIMVEFRDLSELDDMEPVLVNAAGGRAAPNRTGPTSQGGGSAWTTT